jgi:hypothetical protein
MCAWGAAWCCRRDATAAACVTAIRAQLAEARLAQAALAAEVEEERASLERLQQLRCVPPVYVCVCVCV